MRRHEIINALHDGGVVFDESLPVANLREIYSNYVRNQPRQPPQPVNPPIVSEENAAQIPAAQELQPQPPQPMQNPPQQQQREPEQQQPQQPMQNQPQQQQQMQNQGNVAQQPMNLMQN